MLPGNEVDCGFWFANGYGRLNSPTHRGSERRTVSACGLSHRGRDGTNDSNLIKLVSTFIYHLILPRIITSPPVRVFPEHYA